MCIEENKEDSLKFEPASGYPCNEASDPAVISTMKHPLFGILLCLTLVSSSCVHYAVYQNPMRLNTYSYRAIPLQADSAKTAVYGEGAGFFGFSNEGWRDDVSGGYAGIHLAHNFSNFQLMYGVNGAVGQYRASDYLFPSIPYAGYSVFPYDTFLDSINGSKFFGTLGGVMAANYVLPFKNGSEWRVFGAEWNYQYEWDKDYFSFRKKIPVNYANMIDYGRSYNTLSFTSEFIFRDKDQSTFGYKLAMGVATTKGYFYDDPFQKPRTLLRGHMVNTLHFGFRKLTGFAQLMFGYRGSSFQTGLNFRL